MREAPSFLQPFVSIRHSYTDIAEQQRARGLFWLAWGTLIGTTLGLIFQFSSVTSLSHAIFFLFDTPISVTKAAYLVLWLLTVVGVPLVLWFLNQGRLNRAAQMQVGLLFAIAALGYLPNQPTDFFMITFTLPVIGAGVLLSRRALAVVVTATVLTIAGSTLLTSVGLLHLAAGKAEIGDVLVFAPLLMIIDGIILWTFAGRQRILLEHNLTLTRDLQLATEQAQEASRLKSEFMATMSHELRTPLNAMLGFSGLLLEGMLGQIDDEARHMISRIDVNSKRLLSTINDLLDITRIEAGRLQMVNEPFSPQSLAASWVSQMDVLAKQKGLKLEVDIDPHLPNSIYGDQERVTQIATNLLSNAIKFTDQGTVRMALHHKEPNWVIEVSDTGIGIPPHAQTYIFDAFRQVDGSYKRAYGGSGLGLAICRNLTTLMNGSIHLHSELGQGSTFTVTLPLRPVSELQATA
jgi:signal transduction histidine kinase